MATDPDAIHAETLKTTNEADNKMEYIDNMTQRSMRDTQALEGALDSAGNADNVQYLIKETEVKGVEGAHIIRNISSEPLPTVSYI